MNFQEINNLLDNAITKYKYLSDQYNLLRPALQKNYKWNLYKTKKISVEAQNLKRKFLDLYSEEACNVELIKQEKAVNTQQYVEAYNNLLFNIHNRIIYIDTYFIKHSFNFTAIVAYWSLILGFIALLISIFPFIQVINDVISKDDSNKNIQREIQLLEKKVNNQDKRIEIFLDKLNECQKK